MSMTRESTDAPLWAITSYFNPQRFRRRLANYRTFRKHLRVPLVAVELSFGDDFDLRPDDADILIQLRTTDVMWHKERLLNIALGAVPGECRHIAWLDCDVVFERNDWADRTRELLDRFPLVEPFTQAYKGSPDAGPDEVERVPGDRLGCCLAYGLETGAVGFDMLDKNMHTNGCTDGLAWAGRRELFEELGFYDACIMGSGNRAMVCAALGQSSYGMNYLQMNARRTEHYLAWADAHFKMVRGNIGYLDGKLFHLWHGDYKDRRYPERHQDFKAFDFDPFVDIALGQARDAPVRAGVFRQPKRRRVIRRRP